MLWGPLAEEDRSARFRKGLATCMTVKPLHPFAGLAKFDQVLLLIALKLSVVQSGFIWTEIPRFGELLHFISLGSVCLESTSFDHNTQEGDYRKLLSVKKAFIAMDVWVRL